MHFTSPGSSKPGEKKRVEKWRRSLQNWASRPCSLLGFGHQNRAWKLHLPPWCSHITSSAPGKTAHSYRTLSNDLKAYLNKLWGPFITRGPQGEEGLWELVTEGLLGAKCCALMNCFIKPHSIPERKALWLAPFCRWKNEAWRGELTCLHSIVSWSRTQSCPAPRPVLLPHLILCIMSKSLSITCLWARLCLSPHPCALLIPTASPDGKFQNKFSLGFYTNDHFLQFLGYYRRINFQQGLFSWIQVFLSSIAHWGRTIHNLYPAAIYSMVMMDDLYVLWNVPPRLLLDELGMWGSETQGPREVWPSWDWLHVWDLVHLLWKRDCVAVKRSGEPLGSLKYETELAQAPSAPPDRKKGS